MKSFQIVKIKTKGKQETIYINSVRCSLKVCIRMQVTRREAVITRHFGGCTVTTTQNRVGSPVWLTPGHSGRRRVNGQRFEVGTRLAFASLAAWVG